MEVALAEITRHDDAVIEAVRHPDNFETYLRHRTAGRRQYVDIAAEPFFDRLTRIVAAEFVYRAPGSRSFDIAALKQLLAGQERLVAGQEQLLEGQAGTHELLGTMATDIKEIHSAIPHSQPTLPTRIRFGSRPMVTAGFVKREGQDELFDAVFTRAEPKMVLTGIRGTGKTQLAAAVAARCEKEDWPLVAWINAASRKELVANLYELALQAGIDAPKDVPPKVIVRRFLAQQHSADAADRLFVFDNVENLDDLKGLTPEGSGVRVVITTTRHLDWENLEWSPITVGVFERGQSITLLCQRTGDAHRDAADQIAEALGDLPVAVTQAAATAKSGHYPLSKYFERLTNHPLESSISRFEGDDYPDAVGVALFMAYEQALEKLGSKHPQQESTAILLLDALSLLAASGVPTHWLLTLDNDSNAIRDTLSFLERVSIIQESTDGGKTIIHRLQGRTYRETYLNNREETAEANTHATTVLNKVNIKQLNNFEQKRQEIRNLVEQIRSTTLQGYSFPLFFDPTFVSTLATTLRHATNLGMPQLALTLTESVTQACNALGPDHPDTLTSRNNLADAYQDAGRLDEAITLHQQTLDHQTRVLGPDHPDTLTSRNNLADAYQDAGRLDEAITLHQQTLDNRTRVLGPHHPHTLNSRNNLAIAYRTASRLDEAIPLLEHNLEDFEILLGPNHPLTLTTQDNLAIAYRTASRLDEAIPLLEQTLTDHSRTLGPNHTDTLTTQANLAIAYRTAGRLDKAIPLFEQTFKDFEILLGPNHPFTLASRNYLANAYRKAGRFEDADRLFETPSDSEDEQDGTEDDPDHTAGD